MKRIFIYILALSFFASCDKEDKVFDKTVDERIKDTLTKYSNELTGAPNGWVGVVYPKTGGAFSFYFSFSTDLRVQMLADIDSTSATELRESSYRLKALQQPSLIFDTYSYIHQLADPDATVSGGDYGAGLVSDFEFAISDSSNADTIKLTGRFNGSKAWLRKATATEKAAYLDKTFSKQVVAMKGFGTILYYFKRLATNIGNFDIAFNTLLHIVSISWKDSNGTVHRVTAPYYLTATGIVFDTPLIINGQTITGITNLSWNSTTATLSGTVAGAAATITGTNTPVAPDLAAPAQWLKTATDNDIYWYTYYGFHINGVDNAYQLDTLTSVPGPYYYTIYWPGYGSNYDLFAPVFVDTAANGLTLEYGYATGRTVTADGRIIFPYYGTLGTVPASGAAPVTRAQFTNASGYYFVKIADDQYDMVSAADSRIWLTWYLPQ